MQHWQNNIFYLEERLAVSLENQLDTDVVFLVYKNEQNFLTISANKLMLVSASSVFEEMFSGNMRQENEAPIVVCDIDPVIFRAMLKYIYTDQIDVNSWNELAELYGAGKKYMLHALVSHCSNLLVNALRASNVLRAYKFAKFHKEEQMMEAVLQIIRTETIFVLKSRDFKEIDQATLIDILDEEKLNVYEIVLFKALETIALPAVNKREAVKKINFLAMNVEDFLSGPANSDLLSEEESTAILACLMMPQTHLSFYPNGFAKNIREKGRIHFDFKLNGVSLDELVVEFASAGLPKRFSNVFIPYKHFFIRIYFENIVESLSHCSTINTNYLKISGNLNLSDTHYETHKRFLVSCVEYKTGMAIVCLPGCDYFCRVFKGKKLAEDLFYKATNSHGPPKILFEISGQKRGFEYNCA